MLYKVKTYIDEKKHCFTFLDTNPYNLVILLKCFLIGT
jgi:hypothetical protein